MAIMYSYFWSGLMLPSEQQVCSCMSDINVITCADFMVQALHLEDYTLQSHALVWLRCIFWKVNPQIESNVFIACQSFIDLAYRTEGRN